MSDQTETENTTKTEETTPQVEPTPEKTEEEPKVTLQNEGEQNAEKKKKKKNKKKKTQKPQLQVDAPEFQPTQIFQFDPTLPPITSLPVQPSTVKPATQLPKPKSVEEKKETEQKFRPKVPAVKKSVSEQKEEFQPKQQSLESAEKAGPPASKSEQIKTTASRSRKRQQSKVLGGLSVNAPVFNPIFGSTETNLNNQVDSEQENEEDEESMPNFGGYTNPHLNPDQIKDQRIKTEQERAEEESKKVYSLQLMMSLRAQNKVRPVNMALLDFPHKKRKAQFRQAPLSEIDKFNKSVGQIRILLNKLSEGNYDTIEQKLLGDFEYSPSLLNELMKIIFMKSTTEQSFLEIYVKLCVTLFKKFNDKENAEMNFRKLLLNRCEKQFYKMLKREQEDRKSRRASLDEGSTEPLRETRNETNSTSDFNKQMLYVFDESEIRERQKDQMFGNMALIVELYKSNHFKAHLLTTCINELFEEVNNQNVEILCQMLRKITLHQIDTNRKQRQHHQQLSPSKGQTQSQIDLDWVEKTLQQLFAERNNRNLDSRIRFQIQDVMDSYEKDWKAEILNKGQKNAEGETIYPKKNAPKTSVASSEQVKQGTSRGRKSSYANEETKYIYVEKKKPEQQSAAQPSKQTKPQQKTNSMYSLLSGLSGTDQQTSRPGEESQSEDEDQDVVKLQERKVSLNRTNVIGLNLEKYHAFKPSKEVSRMISNLFVEYNSLQDIEHCANEFLDIQTKTGLQTFVFVGYLLNNAFSMDPIVWASISSLVLDSLYTEKKLFQAQDLIEGINVSMTNFVDMLIDYPNSKVYASDMFDKLLEMGVMTKDQNQLYKQHIQNLDNWEDN